MFSKTKDVLNVNLHKLKTVDKAYTTKKKEDILISKLQHRGALNEYQTSVYKDNVQDKFIRCVGVPLQASPSVSEISNSCAQKEVSLIALNTIEPNAPQTRLKKIGISDFFSPLKKVQPATTLTHKSFKCNFVDCDFSTNSKGSLTQHETAHKKRKTPQIAPSPNAADKVKQIRVDSCHRQRTR